jgi:RNA 2',3'-cyclic 3'-phosphodiesterase
LIRTFLAVDLDDAFLDGVAALQDRLRAASLFRSPRWVARTAMHVTLRFFGNVDEARIEALRPIVSELSELAAAKATTALARSLIGFPHARRARVLAIEIDTRGLIESFAAHVEPRAVALGFEAETRAYIPHLTLARLGVPADVTSLASEVGAIPSGRVTAITLYASKTLPSGPVYTRLERAELATMPGGLE